MIKKLLLIISLAAAMEVSAESVLDYSPTAQEIVKMTPEHIEAQKLLATQVMTNYCSGVISDVLLWTHLHRKASSDYRGGEAEESELKSAYKFRKQSVDDYMKSCSWMLE